MSDQNHRIKRLFTKYPKLTFNQITLNDKTEIWN